jgi:lipopolysaccharide transport system ATP-binding protein
MTTIAITVEDLSKSYLVGHQSGQHGHYKVLRDVIGREARDFFRKASDMLHGRQIIQGDEVEEFWALKNVSFEVKKGEALGIIGSNGAGKSTLLKILSRITEPSGGRVTIRGRVASLLEVGTGFHGELTGRENIFLNGAILGMTSAEVRRKFDQIVAFAEVERFVDTPVKRFSSGMYVRLAFAVAAFLEPEILLLDEVLAVGDAQFRKRCLSKLGEVMKSEGRSVVFVSHNMGAIEQLCQTCIWLRGGEVAEHGQTNAVIEAYLEATRTRAHNVPLRLRRDRIGNGRVRATSFDIKDGKGKHVEALQSGGDYTFTIGCENLGDPIKNVVVSLDIYDDQQRRVLLFRSSFTNENLTVAGTGSIGCTVEKFPLANGVYTASIYLSHADAEVLDHVQHAAQFIVEGGDFFGTGSVGLPSHCKVLTAAHWSSEMANAGHNDLSLSQRTHPELSDRHISSG